MYPLMIEIFYYPEYARIYRKFHIGISKADTHTHTALTPGTGGFGAIYCKFYLNDAYYSLQRRRAHTSRRTECSLPCAHVHRPKNGK